MTYALQHVQTKTINHGTVRLLLEDSPDAYVVGPAIPIEGVRDAPFSLDIDSAENKTEGQIQALYGRILKGESSLTVGKIGLSGLKTIVGAHLVESAGVNTIVRIRNTSQLPYVALQYQSNWIPGLEGRARFLVVHRKAKLRELSFEIGQDDFATMEISFASEFSLYPIGGEQELMLLGSEMASTEEIAGSFQSYLPTLQQLPVWQGRSGAGNWSLVVNAAIPRRTTIGTSASGATWFQEWDICTGAGVLTLNVSGTQGTFFGRTDVFVDGGLVGQIDWYDAGATSVAQRSIAFSVTEGAHVLRLQSAGITSGTDDQNVFAEIWYTMAEAVSVNRLPQTVPVTYDLPVSLFDRASTGAGVKITGASNVAGDTVEKLALGDFFEFDLWLCPGTYKIQANVGRSADGAIQTYSVGGQVVGTYDSYNPGTLTGLMREIPGTVTLTQAGPVKVRVLTSGRNVANTTGYRSNLTWVRLIRSSAELATEGPCGPSIHILEPWRGATLSGYTQVLETAAWGGTKFNTGASSNNWIQWANLRLLPGTWRLWVFGDAGRSNFSVTLDAVPLVAIDTGPTVINPFHWTFDFVNSANRLATIRLTNTEAMQSSISYLVLQRIA